MQKGKLLSKSKVEYKPEVKKKLIGVINNLPDPDDKGYNGDKVYDKMMTIRLKTR